MNTSGSQGNDSQKNLYQALNLKPNNLGEPEDRFFICEYGPIPMRDCLRKDALRERNMTFSQWMKQENHVYISVNAKKYLRDENAQDSIWVNPFEPAYKKGEMGLATCLEKYENYVRTELWDMLPELEHKRIGCWCKLEWRCHGDVLLQLFKEHRTQAQQKEYEEHERKMRAGLCR